MGKHFAGLDSVFSGVAKTNKSEKAEKNPSSRETRATFIVKEDRMQKIKAAAYWERLRLKDILDEALKQWLERLEKKNGKLKDVPR